MCDFFFQDKKKQIIKKLMLIMHCCQPLVLIFQFLKIFEQKISTPLSLNSDSIPDKLLLIFARKMILLSHGPPTQS